MDHDSSSRYPADRGYQNRPDSERGTMSSSSGTPSDAHRSPPPAKGWTASPVQQVIGSSAGLNSLSQPAPLPKPDTDFAWTAPPEQSNNNYNYRNDGRPLSPDGWPVKKSEAQLRGNAAPIPDLLSRYVESQPAPPVAATSTGWRSSSSNASKSTTAVAKEIPLPSSEVGDASWSRPTRPGPSPPGSTQPTASSASSQWRASTPKAASPAPIIPIAPVAVAPGAARASSSAHTPPPIHQISQSQADASTGGFDKSLQPDIRVLSGWTVKVPFGQDAHVSAGPPVTATPRHHAQQPPPLARDDKMTREESASTSAGGEAWILSDLNAVKNNDWTSTTRRSRVSKEEQIPTYGRISPYAAVTAGVEDFGDNSIRPSESASNVGGYNDSSSSHPATQREKQTARRPMRQFQGEKDSDLGSNGSSGSLNDNPNARAGGWQRSPTSRDPLEQTLRQSDQQYQGGPQESNYTVPSQAQTSGWIQQPSYNDSKQNSISAPQPRRWDSGSQQLVGDLERAATPRGGYAAPAASVQGRSGSTVGAGRGPGSTISIRGASRYHAESLMLREELDKIRSQVSKYESILSSMDAAQGSGADPELEKENQVLREENRHLRNRVQKLEAEREQLRNALQPVWRLLSAGSKQNGADHLGEMINGHGAQSLQNLSIVDKRESSQAAPLRTVGW